MTNTAADVAREDRLSRAKMLGWAYLSSNRCPLALVGQHWGDDCWCRHRLNDHAATWRDVGRRPSKGTRFVLWEPYGAPGEQVAALVTHAERAGLRVVLGPSVWNPPSTVGIQFMAEDRPRCVVCGRPGIDVGKARLRHPDPADAYACDVLALEHGFS